MKQISADALTDLKLLGKKMKEWRQTETPWRQEDIAEKYVGCSTKTVSRMERGVTFNLDVFMFYVMNGFKWEEQDG